MATRTTQFFYDAVGNRTQVIDPDNRTTYYTYDKVNRLTGISVNPDSKSADYYFDDRGLVTKEIKPNSAVTYYEYDDAGRMTKLDNRKSDLSLISSFEYDRDKSGNITKCHRGDTATIYYTYDRAQRLASEIWKDSGMSTIYSYQYDYDGVGNRTKLLRDLGGGAESIYYYYDAANRLEKEWNTTAHATTYFYYNDNGSVTEIVKSTETVYFKYDDSGFVEKITYPDNSTNEFYYDGRKQRVVISDSDGTSYFDWDDLNPIEEYGNTNAKYIHGYSPVAGVGSLAYAKRDTGYQIPHKDHIGSTRELSDAAEVMTQYYEYDAFGTKLEETGSESNRFQFAANYIKLKDLDNVYLSPTRVYHAGIGRFLQRDPLWDLNLYVYGDSDPLFFVDPAGSYICVAEHPNSKRTKEYFMTWLKWCSTLECKPSTKKCDNKGGYVFTAYECCLTEKEYKYMDKYLHGSQRMFADLLLDMSYSSRGVYFLLVPPDKMAGQPGLFELGYQQICLENLYNPAFGQLTSTRCNYLYHELYEQHAFIHPDYSLKPLIEFRKKEGKDPISVRPAWLVADVQQLAILLKAAEEAREAFYKKVYETEGEAGIRKPITEFLTHKDLSEQAKQVMKFIFQYWIKYIETVGRVGRVYEQEQRAAQGQKEAGKNKEYVYEITHTAASIMQKRHKTIVEKELKSGWSKDLTWRDILEGDERVEKLLKKQKPNKNDK